MKKYVLAIDQGTTSSRCMIFNQQGQCVAVGQAEYNQYYPHPGWVEQDAQGIIASVVEALNNALKNANISPKEIACIGIANQRETTIIWDKHTGRSIDRAIVWQCRRTSSICEQWKSNNWTEIVHERTGLVIDAYFSATKIRWLLDQHLNQYPTPQNDLKFGTVDTWLIYYMTGGQMHLTDESNASRTMLYNTQSRCWDQKLCTLFNIPMDILPEVRTSFSDFGQVAEGIPGLDMLAGVPITGVAGDQAAALFGQGCFEEGDIKNTYGTGCFGLLNTGQNRVISNRGLLSSIAWTYEGQTYYAMEGSVFHAGSVISWLKNELGLIASDQECDALASSVDSSNGVVFVPAFSGLGAPYWDMYARGTIVGLTRGTTRAHIARASIESIAFQVYDLIEVMKEESGFQINTLRVDGGVSISKALLQFQSNILGVSVDRPKQRETTALGAAMIAGLACGFWPDLNTVKALRESDCIFNPDSNAKMAQKSIVEWKKAVKRASHWAPVNQ